VYEDEHILCFHDLEPRAPVHVLIIPKKHIDSLDAVADGDAALLGLLLAKVKDIAALLGLENGYRLVNNCGEDGMQTVKHLHFHLLGKRRLLWPPG
jgi:histidine triad (HIT) family protein